MATTDTGKTTEPARTQRDGELAPTEILDTGSLVDSLDGARAATITNDPPTGSRIGAWSVVDRLGQGGMGTVYRVERADGAFEQEAALKLIQPGAWSEDFGRRLEAERQILANLNHPNIARLLDGGYADDGRPYMVMELINGQPIDQYCRQHRLSVERRLELFAQVCQAVQHAHRALVVHRDLKPSNVVVDADGQVTLLDFGIARVLTPSGAPVEPLTRAMDQVMTPDYASPEQVLGQPVTTATDVYQLGLLLFELLTGRRAQHRDDPSPVAFVRTVCETPAPRPSATVTSAADEAAKDWSTTPTALVRRLRGDLDGIVAMALRKEPERRYGSATALHEDLERHRLGMPVKARPDRLGYRLRRFAGRHRQAIAWSALCLALAVWAVIGSVRERIRGLREAERVRQIEAVVGSLFELPLTTEPGQSPKLNDFVDHAAELIRRDLRDQPASQARLLTRLGKTYGVLGSYRQAVATFEEVLSLVGPSGDTRQRAELLYRLGRNQHFLGLFSAAEESFRNVTSLREGLFGDGDPRTVAIKLELADLLHSLGRLRDAEELLVPAIASLEDASDTPEVRDLRARGQGYLANVLRDRGAYERAEKSYRLAIAGVLELHGPRDRLATSNRIYLARQLAILGRTDEAEEQLESQLKLLREIYFGEHPLTGIALRELGFVAIDRGRFDLAAERLALSKEISTRWVDAEHPTIPRVTAMEAELERRRGQPDEAMRVAVTALDHFARLGLRGHPSALDACMTLGLAAREQGVILEDSAAAHLADCLAAAERELVSGDPRTARLSQLSAGPTAD